MLEYDAKLKYEPYEMVRKAGRIPKTMFFKSESGEEYYIEPEIVGTNMETAKIYYTLPSKWARVLLADERYSLVKPSRMVVPTRGKYGNTTKVVIAIADYDDIGPALSNEEIEDLKVKQEIKKQKAEKDLASGLVPESMVDSVAILEAKNKVSEEAFELKSEEKAAALDNQPKVKATGKNPGAPKRKVKSTL